MEMTQHNDQSDSSLRYERKIALSIPTGHREQRVFGQISKLSKREIEVEILEPYSGIFSRTELPYLPTSLGWFSRNGKLTTQGRTVAERLIAELYEHCQLFDEQASKLRVSYLDLLHQKQSAQKNGSAVSRLSQLIQGKHGYSISESTLLQLIDEFLC